MLNCWSLSFGCFLVLNVSLYFHPFFFNLIVLIIIVCVISLSSSFKFEIQNKIDMREIIFLQVSARLPYDACSNVTYASYVDFNCFSCLCSRYSGITWIRNSLEQLRLNGL